MFIKLTSKEGIMAAGAGALGTGFLVATGFAIRGAKKAKKAMERTEKLESKVNKLTEKVKDLNQNKLNEKKLYELDRDLEILKSRKEVNEILNRVDAMLKNSNIKELISENDESLKELSEELHELLDDPKENKSNKKNGKK